MERVLLIILTVVVAFIGVNGECLPHDPSIYICCNDVLNPRPPNAMCCQTKAFNTQTHQCCNGVINPRPEGDARCCQHQSFNALTHHCCEGTVNPRACGNVTCCKFIGFCTDTHFCCPQVPAVMPIGLPCPLSLSNDQIIPPLLDPEVGKKKKTHRSSLKHKGIKHKE